MSYRVVTYDRATERMTGSIAIPSHLLSKVKRIAGFQPQDDGLGEYPIDEEQTKQVAQILGFNPEPGDFFITSNRMILPGRVVRRPLGLVPS